MLPTLARAGLLLALVLTGCAGDYVARTRGVRAAYERERYDDALHALESAAKESPAEDRLLVLMDRGMILHSAGRWKESIQVLAEAERVASELDVVSVSEQAQTLLTTEREKYYRGEDFERLMISVLQALNYAQLGDDEAALVEVRRCNERLQRMVQEEKKPYEQLAIARYLGGALYEDQGNLDSAYIDYTRALESALVADPTVLAEPLLRLARQTRRLDDYDRLRARFPGVEHAPLGPGEGQLVVVVQAGLSPEKEPQDRRQDVGDVIQIPAYRDRGRPAPARVTVTPFGAGGAVAGTGGAGAEPGREASATVVTSLQDVARVHLNDRIGRMLLKQVAGAVVKGAVAGGVGAITESKELAALTFLLLNAGNRPDLRAWMSLPAQFQVARFRLPAGTHTVRVGAHTRDAEVRPGRVAVVTLRQY